MFAALHQSMNSLVPKAFVSVENQARSSGRVSGLEDAAVDAAAEMLNEGAEKPPVEIGEHEVAVEKDFCTAHDRMVLVGHKGGR